MAREAATGEGGRREAGEGMAPQVRSFDVNRFIGYKNAVFLPFMCCMILLLWITCGCACFCAVPVSCFIMFLLLPVAERVEFNNETRMLVSQSFPPVEYERVHMEAVFFVTTSSVHVYLFLDDVEPLPLRRGISWMMYSPRMQDPKFDLPLRGTGPNTDVDGLRDMMNEISAFTGIPARGPAHFTWEQIEERVLLQTNPREGLREPRPSWAASAKS